MPAPAIPPHVSGLRTQDSHAISTLSRPALLARYSDRSAAVATVVPLVHERTIIGRSAGVSGLSTDPYERLLITAKTRVS